jgi:hypothetical protein
MAAMPSQKLWRNRPDVLAGNVLDGMSKDEISRQDAIYEMLTTELSYMQQVESLLSVSQKTRQYQQPRPVFPCLLPLSY